MRIQGEQPGEAAIMRRSMVFGVVIGDERIRALRKHGDRSMEAYPAMHPARLSILVEELGEVAKEINDAAVESRVVDHDALRDELVQVAAMAIAWADALELSLGATAKRARR